MNKSASQIEDYEEYTYTRRKEVYDAEQVTIMSKLIEAGEKEKYYYKVCRCVLFLNLNDFFQD